MFSGDLKDVGKLRKALLPVVKMIQHEINEENKKRFELIDKKIDKIAAIKPVINLEKVNVPQPDINVHVDIPDVLAKAVSINSSDLNTLLGVLKTMQSQTIKAEQITYLPHDQDNGNMIKYNGFVALDGQWYIQRVTKGEQRYVKGNGNYSEAWDNRTKLGYGMADRD